MKKLIEKEVCGVKIVIAQNANGEVKFGAESDFEDKNLSTFAEEKWYGIGMDLLHLKAMSDGIYCNFGAGLSVENDKFPYKILDEDEMNMVLSLAQSK